MDTPNLPQPVTRQDSQELAFIAEVLDRCLREPLAALRATLDTFARRLDGRSETTIANAALDRVVELGRTVQELHDFAAPPPLRPMRCSVEEIVRDALDEFGPEQRPSIMTALDDSDVRLLVDGPLLSRSLAHLMAEGLRGDGECMLHTRRFGEELQFVIVHTPPLESEEDKVDERPGSLGLLVARRDVLRMGGSISFRASHSTSTTTVDGLSEDGVARVGSREVAA